MKERLQELITSSIKELFDLVDIEFNVDQPAELDMGDYASNIALVISKQLSRKPLELAEILVQHLRRHKDQYIDSISIAGPGFINFKLNQDFFSSTIKKILSLNEKWGQTDVYKNKKILIEHSSPNLFKPFHIGHLMNNTIGESMVRLAKFSGSDVVTMTFPSDISLGIAKAIFVILEKIEQDKDFEWQNIKVLGDSYVEGTKKYELDLEVQQKIKYIANNLHQNVDSAELSLFKEAKRINIAYFEKIIKRLGSNFDTYIYESEAGIVGKKIVLENTPAVFTESEGAIVYIPDESRKDINIAVFINSQKNPTYEAKDIGLLSIKFEKYNPDYSIFVTDNQQISHFEVVLDAASHINKDWSTKSLHIHHGRMSFKGQKMSSRLGGVPLAEEVLETIADEVQSLNQNIDDKETEIIALSALKISILRSAVGKDINFDPETSLSFEGDSGPYLLYSTVRAKSILNKRGQINISAEIPQSWTTIMLEKELIHFPEIIRRSTEEWAPHYLVNYLLSIARSFNSWYGNTQIISDADTSSPYKLAITESFVNTMTNGLFLLGINVPEKM